MAEAFWVAESYWVAKAFCLDRDVLGGGDVSSGGVIAGGKYVLGGGILLSSARRDKLGNNSAISFDEILRRVLSPNISATLIAELFPSFSLRAETFWVAESFGVA